MYVIYRLSIVSAASTTSSYVYVEHINFVCINEVVITISPPHAVLDIAKHTALYLSALGLLYSLTLHPSLFPLLSLPIFPTSSGDSPPMTSSSEGGLSLISLSRRLKTTVISYSRTTRSVAGSTAPFSTIEEVPP